MWFVCTSLPALQSHRQKGLQVIMGYIQEGKLTMSVDAVNIMFLVAVVS